MSNITVTVGSFESSSDKTFNQYIPIVVYTNQVSVKTFAAYRPDLTDDHTISWGLQSASLGNDVSTFQIYPIGVNGDIVTQIQKISALEYDYILNYPSMTVDPNGRLISAPIFVDKIDQFRKNKLSISEPYPGSELIQTTVATWTPSGGIIQYTNINAQDALYPYGSDADPKEYPIYNSPLIANENNFGNSHNLAADLSSDVFSMIQGIDRPLLGDANYPVIEGDEMKKFCRRIYNLSSFDFENCPENYQSFYIAVKPNTLTNAAIYIDWGCNRIDITKDGVCISCAEKEWFDGCGKITEGQPYPPSEQESNSNQNSNSKEPKYVNRRRMFLGETTPLGTPAFLNGNKIQQLANGYSLLVYPQCGGIALQTGIDFGVSIDAEDVKISKGRGVFCPVGESKDRFDPPLLDWYKGKKGVSSGTNTGTTTVAGAIQLIGNATEKMSNINLIANNCTVNFFYTPLYFIAYSRFRLYFSGAKSQPSNSDSGSGSGSGSNSNIFTPTAAKFYTQKKTSDASGSINSQRMPFLEITFYGTLIYATANNSSLSDILSTRQAYHTASDSQADRYYFDFTIDLTKKHSTGLMTSPLEIIGVIIIEQSSMLRSLLETDHGTFSLNKKSFQVLGQTVLDKWQNAIQNVSVNWTQQGGTGTITLDRYALLNGDQLDIIKQKIGGISLDVSGGIYTGEDYTYTPGRIFTGLATKMSFASSFNSDTITVTLQGIQRKLQDLKIVNAPYFDGDTVETVLSYFKCYAGINIETDAGQVLTPTSSNFGKPALDLKMGTSVLQGLKQLGHRTGCRLILQPDGGIDFRFQNPTTAIPPPYGDKTNIDVTEIIQFSIQPALNNLHNFLAIASYRQTKKGNQIKFLGTQTMGFPANYKYGNLPTEPDIPWSRVTAEFIDTALDTVGLDNQWTKRSNKAKYYFLNVNVTILGHGDIDLYQKVTLPLTGEGKADYFVTGISHNVDLASKKWTTTLTLEQQV